LATLTELLADIRAATDHDTDTAVTDAQLTSWINQEYFAVRRVLGDVAPTLYTAATTFSIVAGNTYTIVAADFSKVRRLERSNGSSYDPMRVASAVDPEGSCDYTFLERSTVLEIYPSNAAVTSYRLNYITKPAKLTAGADVCDVPEGVERVIVEKVAARVRIRLEEDPSPHLQAASAALQEAKSYLQKRYGTHAEGLRTER
jgi:hypothetical protein